MASVLFTMRNLPPFPLVRENRCITVSAAEPEETYLPSDGIRKFYFCGSSEIPGGPGRGPAAGGRIFSRGPTGGRPEIPSLEINKKAAAFYYYQLKSEKGKQGMEYLKKRELSDETIRNSALAVLPGIPAPCTNI